MKVVSKLAVLISISAFAASFASAKTDEQAYLETVQVQPNMPAPLTVVSPVVSSEYEGTTVELEFVVDVTGKPTNLVVKSITDSTVTLAVTEAVKQWRFKPAEVDGKPVAKKVLLPIKFVDELSPAAGRVALN